MILPRRTVLSLLIALVMANILFRYPIGTPHELGADTTFIHSLSDTLKDEGYAPWILHPASYFGLYALSYPSAIPFTLAAGSLVGGIPVEGVILFLGWIASIVGALGAFL